MRTRFVGGDSWWIGNRICDSTRFVPSLFRRCIHSHAGHFASLDCKESLKEFIDELRSADRKVRQGVAQSGSRNLHMHRTENNSQKKQVIVALDDGLTGPLFFHA